MRNLEQYTAQAEADLVDITAKVAQHLVEIEVLKTEEFELLKILKKLKAPDVVEPVPP